ncbi:MAG: hypothetical protein GXO32_04630 [Crenarchaeota archaeon]|nr:hypothetical protein [Thermoproteota archaeon]
MPIDLGRLEELSRVVEQAIESIVQGSSSVSIVYDIYTRGLARVARAALKLADPGRALELVDAYSYPTMELPYVSERVSAILAFLRAPQQLHQLATAARLLQMRALAITTRLPSQIRKALRGFSALELDSDLYTLAALVGVLRAASRSSVARVARVGRELEIGPELVSDVEERFSHLAKLASSSLVLCTAATEPLCDELRFRGASAIYIHDALSIPCQPSVTLVYTSCEDHVVAQFLLSYRRRCGSAAVSSIRVNTDPLTASLYLLLAISGARGYGEQGL